MKRCAFISLVAASIAVFALSSCVAPSPEVDAPSAPVVWDGMAWVSVPDDYRDNDFYYYTGGAYPVNYEGSSGSHVSGYSYYHGTAVCPICHHSPCTGHSGRASSWSHHSSSSRTQHEKDHHASSPGKSQKDKDDHALGGRDEKPAFSWSKYQAQHDQPSSSGSSSSSSSTSSSGSGSSSKKKDKDDDKKKKD